MAEVKKDGLAVGMIAMAVLAAVPLTTQFEGLRRSPYRDPANILTVCYGETEREMRTYTLAECASLLRDRQANDYAAPLLQCVPGFRHHLYPFAAAVDAAYNAGVPAFCRSRMAQAFRAGLWEQGCNGFPGWYETARVNGVPTKLPGLQRRRLAEKTLCLKG